MTFKVYAVLFSFILILHINEGIHKKEYYETGKPKSEGWPIHGKKMLLDSLARKQQCFRTGSL